MEKHLSILQVARHAEPEVIKAAYRALAAKYHPDALPYDATALEREVATARMVAINLAFEVLKGGLAPEVPPASQGGSPGAAGPRWNWGNSAPQPASAAAPPQSDSDTPGPQPAPSGAPPPSSWTTQSVATPKIPEDFEAALTLPNYWKEMARWGKETERLDSRERKFTFTVGKGIAEKWDFTSKQLVWARAIWDRVNAEFHSVLADAARR